MRVSKVTVNIYTFGYHRSGIPSDPSGNGGGFVFDCRCIPNPGLEPGNMALTGQNPEIVYLLENNTEAQRFFSHVTSTVDLAVDQYRQFGYQSLMVAFGCTGGQHRSVYFAEKLAKHLLDQGYHVEITHRERHLWP